MLERITDKCHTMEFDSIAELVMQLDRLPRRWPSEDSRTAKASDRWDNGVGWQGALRMAVEGWEEGVGKVSALVDSLPMGARAVRTYSAAGDYPDVPRAVSGDPFNMVRRGMAHKQRPTMTIVVNCCCSAAVPASAMMNYAAAMVSVVDRLENRGVSVELIGCAVSALRGKRGMVAWTIKKAGDPVDLSAVAYGIGHPAMFRRLCFAAWERFPREMHTYGYGRVTGALPSDFIDLSPEALIIDGVGEGNGAHCRTLELAVKSATAQVNRAAAKLGEDGIAELEAL